MELNADGARHLAAAIVLLAVKDAKAGDPEAALWLGSRWCAALCDGLDVDPATARALGRHYARRRRR